MNLRRAWAQQPTKVTCDGGNMPPKLTSWRGLVATSSGCFGDYGDDSAGVPESSRRLDGGQSPTTHRRGAPESLTHG